jgi:predicted amidophosphoribosyltransferase
MFEIPLLLLVLAVTLVLIVAPGRRGGEGQRVCRNCGASHPPFAQFCRRCGRKL